MSLSYEKLCNLLKFKLFDVPFKFDISDSLSILKLKLSSEDIFHASVGVFVFSLLFFMLCLFLFSFFGFRFKELFFLSPVFSFFLAFVFFYYPVFRSRMLIIDSLSSSPVVLAHLVSLLKVNPNLELAIRETLKYCSGVLKESFLKVVRTGFKEGDIKSQLHESAVYLGRFSPAFKRSLFLVRSALSESSVVRRREVLDKSVSVFLSEVKMNLQEFSQRLITPTLIVFVVGTLLPLIIISVVPLLNIFGSVSALFLIVLSLVLVSFFIFVYTSKILIEKPVLIFSDKSQKSPFSFRFFSLSLLIFLVLSFPSFLFLLSSLNIISLSLPVHSFVSSLNSLPFIIALSLSVSCFFFLSSRSSVKESKRIILLEEELPDVIYSIASELDDGRPLESALLNASESISGEFKIILKTAWSLLKNRHVSVSDAFFSSEFGALKNVNSSLINSVFRFVSFSYSKGSNIVVSTLFAFHSYLMDLHQVNFEFKNKLSQSLGMMKNSVLFFAPIICGLVIMLNKLIETRLSETASRLSHLGYNLGLLNFSASSVNTEFLQIAVGLYLLIFSFIMVRFVVFIDRGEDNNLLKYELARIVPISVLIFVFTLLISKKLFGV